MNTENINKNRHIYNMQKNVQSPQIKRIKSSNTESLTSTITSTEKNSKTETETETENERQPKHNNVISIKFMKQKNEYSYQSLSSVSWSTSKNIGKYLFKHNHGSNLLTPPPNHTNDKYIHDKSYILQTQQQRSSKSVLSTSIPENQEINMSNEDWHCFIACFRRV